jgi:lipid II:glycine glycyltransferase (peptidoglycan interpeptide bridge formation enzyme)
MTRKIFKLLMSPLHGSATPYGGPVIGHGFDISLYRKVFEKLDEFIRDERVDFTQILSSPTYSNEDCLKQTRADYDLIFARGTKYQFRNRYTELIDLTSGAEKLWANLHKHCRTAIRKAEKNKLEIVEEESEKIFDQYYEMSKDTYDRSNQGTGISKDMYLSVYSKFKENNATRVLSAYYRGSVIAGAFFLLYRDVVYFWDAVSFRNYLDMAPNNLIQWELLKWASKSDYKLYDMVGVNIPNIAKFKQSFGGHTVPYACYTGSSNLFVKLGARLYERAFPFYRRAKHKLKKKISRQAAAHNFGNARVRC